MSSPQLRVISWGTLHDTDLPSADLVANVSDRFRDPHIDPKFREMNGRDQAAVVDKVMKTEGVFFYTKGLYRALLPLILIGGPPVVLVVACRGGRHRSVVIADEVARIADTTGWAVAVEHVHIHKPVLTSARGGSRG